MCFWSVCVCAFFSLFKKPHRQKYPQITIWTRACSVPAMSKPKSFFLGQMVGAICQTANHIKCMRRDTELDHGKWSGIVCTFSALIHDVSLTNGAHTYLPTLKSSTCSAWQSNKKTKEKKNTQKLWTNPPRNGTTNLRSSMAQAQAQSHRTLNDWIASCMSLFTYVNGIECK